MTPWPGEFFFFFSQKFKGNLMKHWKTHARASQGFSEQECFAMDGS